MTFKERFLQGDCSIGVIHDLVHLWHCGYPVGQPLYEFLGLTAAEFSLWDGGTDQALADSLLQSRPNVLCQYGAFYLTWNELTEELETLVKSLLGSDYSIEIEREDDYSWDMILFVQEDVDEDLSRHICETLAIRGIDADYFLWDESVENWHLTDLLSKLVHRDVQSSHADENGVWVICNTRQPANESEAAQ